MVHYALYMHKHFQQINSHTHVFLYELLVSGTNLQRTVIDNETYSLIILITLLFATSKQYIVSFPLVKRLLL